MFVFKDLLKNVKIVSLYIVSYVSHLNRFKSCYRFAQFQFVGKKTSSKKLVEKISQELNMTINTIPLYRNSIIDRKQL